MENERSIDKLARYLIHIGVFGAICALCWYFRSVLIYIIAAFVISLIGQPVIRLLRKIRFKGKAAPDWLLSILTIVLIILLFLLFITQAIPVVTGIIRDASVLNSQGFLHGNPLNRFNDWLISVFPSLGADFDAFGLLMDQLKEVLNFSNVSGIMTSVIGSVASAVTSMAIGAFATIFISFFFIRDDQLFGRIVGALVSDKIEPSVNKAIQEIEILLSRYFVGLIIEIAGVALADFLGLWLVARLGISHAIGIAFIAGVLNVIPYVGPLTGEILGVALGVILKVGAGAGLDVNVWLFAVIVFGVMLFAQLIDNFVYQPLIYSTSIKASPLEIFIVLLIAGHIGGILGMLLAIPAYTVVRVIASRFFYDLKPIRRLIPDLSQEDEMMNVE